MSTSFDESVGGIASVVGVLLPLTITTFVMRCVARRLQGVRFDVDDWFMLPALICFIAICGIAIYGMVNHFVAFPMTVDKAFLGTELPIWIKSYWAADLLSVLALGCIRTSALFFYRRIFVVRQKRRWFDTVTIIAIVVVLLWTLAWILLQIFTCGGHFNLIWSLSIEQDCINKPYLESVAASSFILDVLVLLLPIPIILSLHTTASRKLGITAVFLLAIAGTAASCTRMVINFQNLAPAPQTKKDQFLSNTQLLYYLILEAGLCFIAVNLPSLWYFVSNGTVLENVVRSVRSLVSLGSFQSRASTNLPHKTSSSDVAESTSSRIEATTEIEVKHEDDATSHNKRSIGDEEQLDHLPRAL